MPVALTSSLTQHYCLNMDSASVRTFMIGLLFVSEK